MPLISPSRTQNSPHEFHRDTSLHFQIKGQPPPKGELKPLRATTTLVTIVQKMQIPLHIYLMPVTPLFVKGKYDAAEMYLEDGTHSSKLKSKSLILKVGVSQSPLGKGSSSKAALSVLECRTSHRIKVILTHTQKDTWL